MNHNHSLLSTLTRMMVPAISEILEGNSRRTFRESSISNWQTNGELSTPCLGSAKHSYNVVFSSEKVAWISRYTDSTLYDGRSSVLGAFQRMILRVKSMSSMMIYGITWYPKHMKEPIVGWSWPHLLQIGSEYFSKFQGWIPQWDSRITPLGCRRGTLSWLLSTL